MKRRKDTRGVRKMPWCPPACCICYELLSKDLAVLRYCGHVFHQRCINDWIRRKRSCPLCREPIIDQGCVEIRFESCTEYRSAREDLATYELEELKEKLIIADTALKESVNSLNEYREKNISFEERFRKLDESNKQLAEEIKTLTSQISQLKRENQTLIDAEKSNVKKLKELNCEMERYSSIEAYFKNTLSDKSLQNFVSQITETMTPTDAIAIQHQLVLDVKSAIARLKSERDNWKNQVAEKSSQVCKLLLEKESLQKKLQESRFATLFNSDETEPCVQDDANDLYKFSSRKRNPNAHTHGNNNNSGRLSLMFIDDSAHSSNDSLFDSQSTLDNRNSANQKRHDNENIGTQTHTNYNTLDRSYSHTHNCCQKDHFEHSNCSDQSHTYQQPNQTTDMCTRRPSPIRSPAKPTIEEHGEDLMDFIVYGMQLDGSTERPTNIHKQHPPTSPTHQPLEKDIHLLSLSERLALKSTPSNTSTKRKGATITTNKKNYEKRNTPQTSTYKRLRSA